MTTEIPSNRRQTVQEGGGTSLSQNAACIMLPHPELLMSSKFIVEAQKNGSD